MIGRMIAGRYRIIQALSAGGMGETFIAEDTQYPNHLQCVVKRLLPACHDPIYLNTVKSLFRKEAEILAKVGRHDQIPQLLAYPEDNNEFYLIQEYIKGHTLSAELTQRWSEPQVLGFLKDMLILLEFLQNQDPQVIHRDIKPDNIIRRKQDGKLVLIDFGAVKQWQAQQLTLMGQPTIMIGTLGYMPPEQARGQPRLSSDLYAVGMIAIQALTGVLPNNLTEDEDGEKLWQHKISISDGLIGFLTKMVRYHFKYRFQTATEARQALRNLIYAATTVAGQYSNMPHNTQNNTALESLSIFPKASLKNQSTIPAKSANASLTFDKNLSDKKRIKLIRKHRNAGICGILLGCFGIHKFILGYHKEGLLMLSTSSVGNSIGNWYFSGYKFSVDNSSFVSILVDIILAGLYLSAILMAITGMIEGIIYLRKSNDEFEKTYIRNHKPWF